MRGASAKSGSRAWRNPSHFPSCLKGCALHLALLPRYQCDREMRLEGRSPFACAADIPSLLLQNHVLLLPALLLHMAGGLPQAPPKNSRLSSRSISGSSRCSRGPRVDVMVISGTLTTRKSSLNGHHLGGPRPILAPDLMHRSASPPPFLTKTRACAADVRRQDIREDNRDAPSKANQIPAKGLLDVAWRVTRASRPIVCADCRRGHLLPLSPFSPHGGLFLSSSRPPSPSFLASCRRGLQHSIISSRRATCAFLPLFSSRPHSPSSQEENPLFCRGLPRVLSPLGLVVVVSSRSCCLPSSHPPPAPFLSLLLLSLPRPLWLWALSLLLFLLSGRSLSSSWWRRPRPSRWARAAPAWPTKSAQHEHDVNQQEAGCVLTWHSDP